MVFAFCLGFVWSVYRAYRLMVWHLSADQINRPLLADGIIISLPQETNDALRFYVELRHLDHKSVPYVRVYLKYYGHFIHFSVGDVWSFVVKLKPVYGLHNPGDFNYARYLLIQGVRSVGYVRRGTATLIRHQPWYHPLDTLRQKIQDGIKQAVHDPDLAGILVALSVGSKSLLRPQCWKVFQNTGTAHLIAISGLHIGFVASLFYGLCFFLWSRFSFFLLYIAAPRVAGIAALIASVIYALLAGYSLPTERAVIMISVMILSDFFCYHISLWFRLLFAFFMVVVIQPFSLFSDSFWLTFFAVGVVAYAAYMPFSRNRRFFMKWLRLQIIFLFLLSPLNLMLFHQLSWLSLVANVIAIPWVGFLIVPLLLLSDFIFLLSHQMGYYCFTLSAWVLHPLWYYLHALSHGSVFIWHHVVASFWIFLMGCLGICIVCGPKGLIVRWVGVLWMLPLLFPRMVFPREGEAWCTLLDVGQGLSVVIQTKYHILIYDTGPKYWTGFDAGAQVVIPYLKRQGIHAVDRMIVSHADNDHSGGVRAILQGIPVSQILTSVPKRFPHAQSCIDGQRWVWDNVVFEMLSPGRPLFYKGNNSSCVLKVTSAGGTGRAVLLVGDIEKRRENWLLMHHQKQLFSDVLIAPHHGSGTSSTEPFIQAVHPHDVLFAVSAYNRYGFPNADIVRRYRRLGAIPLTTARSGAVFVDLPIHANTTIRVTYQKHYFWQS